MSEPFIGEIRFFGFNFAPRGWAMCDGQLLSIQQHAALFSLLSTIYGGDGRTTFALPDLRGRVPMGMGDGPGLTSRVIGARSGVETVDEVPPHTHTASLYAEAGLGTTNNPLDMMLASPKAGTANIFAVREERANKKMHPDSIEVDSAGSSAGDNNMQPYLVLNACIALEGIYPQRN
ncbi:MAG: phage tail protein [Candidatus Electrothrix sp. AW3_4]|nr:phage tail protein [Candidatus Electrothrix gigas]